VATAVNPHGYWVSGESAPICTKSTATPANTLPLSRTQFDALVLGLPWQRLGDAGIIRVI